MALTRRAFTRGAVSGIAGLATAACSSGEQDDAATSASSAEGRQVASAKRSSLTLNRAAWLYNADDDVYYQLGIPYCETPADAQCERLAIFVPAAFFDATDNGDGTFTCTRAVQGIMGTYTPTTAPIVMPIDTPGYSAQAPLSEYVSFSAYLKEGLVYVHAGCRGREAGAPAGVVDIKAAIRFLRYVTDDIAGDPTRIVTFGMSGGGAQSVIVGATGDSELFEPYLSAIGAVTAISDSIHAMQAWCPITGLDVGDAAYEWMLGSTRTNLTEEEQRISDGLAEQFVAYINEAGFVYEGDERLTLEESTEGIYQAGSYYDRLRALIENSLANFLRSTEFPYDASAQPAMGGPGEGGPDGRTGEAPVDDISRTESAGGLSLTGTYATATDYVNALNAEGEWVSYDEETGEVTITSVAAFCAALKRASKGLGAFDQLDRGQGENMLFGVNGAPAHFDEKLHGVLEDMGSGYAQDFADDLALTDGLGIDMRTRVNMYTPLYFLLQSSEGYGTSEVATHWRIRTGIEQGDTPLTTELNLYFALNADERVASIDFETVWGQGHTKAERTDDAETNFISWVTSIA